MAKIHEIDGKKYVEVERKAKVGDKIVTVRYEGNATRKGKIETVRQARYSDGSVKTESGAFFDTAYLDSYRVLEPFDNNKSISNLTVDLSANTEFIEIIANLACRVASIEQQLTDAQRNIERQSYELAETDAKAEMLLKDIVMLDERTSTEQADVVTFDKFLDSVANKVAERLFGGGRK
jgi:hypothetical protein